MFSCKKSIDLLLGYLDGDIPADEEQHLHEHLSACPPCVDFLKTYRATPALCKKALAAKMPEELSSKLTDFLRAKASAKKA
jgi:anti-sigma factor RsiW